MATAPKLSQTHCRNVHTRTCKPDALFPVQCGAAQPRLGGPARAGAAHAPRARRLRAGASSAADAGRPSRAAARGHEVVGHDGGGRLRSSTTATRARRAARGMTAAMGSAGSTRGAARRCVGRRSMACSGRHASSSGRGGRLAGWSRWRRRRSRARAAAAHGAAAERGRARILGRREPPSPPPRARLRESHAAPPRREL